MCIYRFVYARICKYMCICKDLYVCKYYIYVYIYTYYIYICHTGIMFPYFKYLTVHMLYDDSLITLVLMGKDLVCDGSSPKIGDKWAPGISI